MVGRIVSIVPVAFTLLVSACAGAGPSSTPPSSTDTKSHGTSAGSTVPDSPDAPASNVTATTSSPTPALTDEQILARVRSDLLACYQQGKKSTPAMADGKLTLLASVDAAGKTTCVVPTDDTGLTQEVEDCMSSRLGRETFTPGTSWSFELPIAVRGGAVTLGKETTGPVIDEVSEHGLPDAMKVVQGLLPKLSECVQPVEKGSGLRVIHIGARVGSDGRVSCTVATGAGTVPEEVRTCSRSTLEAARFGAPKSGAGLVSIPVKILAAR